MKNKNMHWHAEGQHHDDPKVQFCGSEYQLVKDGRPYGSICLTTDVLEKAFRPEAENPRTATHLGLAREYSRESSNEYARKESNPRGFYAEDINTEAEEFIQMEHQKLNFGLNKRTWSSG